MIPTSRLSFAGPYWLPPSIHQDHWVDFPSIAGASVANIGVLLQVRAIRWHLFTNPRTFYDFLPNIVQHDLFALTSYSIETA